MRAYDDTAICGRKRGQILVDDWSAWIGSLEPDLAGHGHRVARTVRLMLEALQPDDPNLVVHAELVATVHDIGKLALERRIFDRTGPLTAVEYAYVQRHAEIGANVVTVLGFDDSAAIAVRRHHEWWNGEGYPDGVSGTDIPLISRLIAVADAYDAMTSRRPYRQPVSADAAILELQRFAGRQFDPAVVGAFVESRE